MIIIPQIESIFLFLRNIFSVHILSSGHKKKALLCGSDQ